MPSTRWVCGLVALGVVAISGCSSGPVYPALEVGESQVISAVEKTGLECRVNDQNTDAIEYFCDGEELGQSFFVITFADEDLVKFAGIPDGSCDFPNREEGQLSVEELKQLELFDKIGLYARDFTMRLVYVDDNGDVPDITPAMVANANALAKPYLDGVGSSIGLASTSIAAICGW